MGEQALCDFDTIIDRRHDRYSYSAKWDAAQGTAEHCGVSHIDDEHISLFTADMDFRTAPAVIDALHATVDHGIFGYSTLNSCPEYYQAICGWFDRRDGWKIDPARIVYTPGTVHALELCVEAFTQPGDGVIIQRPVYPPFTSAVEHGGRHVLNNQLIRHTAGDTQGDLYYEMDFAGLEELTARDDARMLILCNPHNPVGRAWTVDELKRVAQICAAHDVLIVADEIHGDLMREGLRINHLAQVAPETRSVTCTAVNKTFNLAGLAATNLVFSDTEDQKRFCEVQGYAEPSPFAISAVVAAYSEGEDWLEALRSYLDKTIDDALAFFAEQLPDVGMHRPEGTYILWFDFEARCRKLGIDGAELHRRIYEDAKVLLQDGENFDPAGGEFFQRMCIPSPRAQIMEACRRIANVLAG